MISSKKSGVTTDLSSVSASVKDTENNLSRTESGNLVDVLKNDGSFETRRKGRVIFRDDNLTETFDDTDLWVQGEKVMDDFVLISLFFPSLSLKRF